MVGEIRDLETAEIAIKAAQTGHMVMSTLHTNSAAETLTRLRNMGVAAFNLATSVNLIIAQRLARKLCACKEEIKVPDEVLLKEGFQPEQIGTFKVYGPKAVTIVTVVTKAVSEYMKWLKARQSYKGLSWRTAIRLILIHRCAKTALIA